MRRCCILVVVFMCLSLRLLFALSLNIHQRRWFFYALSLNIHQKMVFFFWIVSMAFMLWSLWILFLIVFLSLAPKKSEPNFWFIFCIRQNFQCTISWAHFNSGFLSFSIFTSKYMDLESGHLGSYPDLNCSSVLEFWAS